MTAKVNVILTNVFAEESQIGDFCLAMLTPLAPPLSHFRSFIADRIFTNWHISVSLFNRPEMQKIGKVYSVDGVICSADCTSNRFTIIAYIVLTEAKQNSTREREKTVRANIAL